MLEILSDYKLNIDRIHAVSSSSHDASLYERVDTIKRRVISDKDSALKEYAQQFDRVKNDFNLKVSDEEFSKAYSLVPNEFVEALKRAHSNIQEFHTYQQPVNSHYQPNANIEYGLRYTPLERAGLYVPGGQAAYPSSVLMDIIPAKIAGVKQIVVVTPPQPDGSIPPQTLVAADICGIRSVYKVGGAQAVFALAYGTETIPKVDKIVGPGNKFVTLAKQMVYGEVDIDKPAGPSEALIYIDKLEYAAYAAAELLAQLEHDPDCSGVIVSESQDILKAVQTELTTQFPKCKRQSILKQSLNQALLLLAKDKDEAIEIIDYVASEHFVILSDQDQLIFDKTHNCSSVFLGPYTPVALGDYYAGPNHVLPTSGTARFSSGLSVIDFLKRQSVIKISKSGIERLGPSVINLANYENLHGHAASIKMRIKKGYI